MPVRNLFAEHQGVGGSDLALELIQSLVANQPVLSLVCAEKKVQNYTQSGKQTEDEYPRQSTDRVAVLGDYQDNQGNKSRCEKDVEDLTHFFGGSILA